MFLEMYSFSVLASDNTKQGFLLRGSYLKE